MEKKHFFEEDIEDRTPLSQYEHDWKVIVDFGLFMFGLANAGVAFSAFGTATWLVLVSLLAGKSVGVFTFGNIAKMLGFPLPTGMSGKDLLMAGVIAGIGFTVALFVAGEAFTDPVIQGAAKMGAMLSFVAAIIAVPLGKILRIRKVP